MIKFRSVSEASEMWGGLLWKKEEYFRLLPDDNEWKKLVEETLNEVDENRKQNLAFSPREYQCVLYSYYVDHTDKPLPKSYIYLKLRNRDKSMQEVSDMVKKAYFED